MIYDLPESPSARDIIRRSIVAHPSAFRDSLIAQAEMHDNYLQLSRNEAAKRGALTQKKACLLAYDIIGDDSQSDDERADKIVANFSAGIIALNVAAKLQCLPPHVRTASALKQWES